jgi:predicted metal-dependent phosphoesterase TrpH
MPTPTMMNRPGAHVDFHMHSTLSDGRLSVRELIDYCVEQGLSAISITDHDNIDAYEEGREYAEEAGSERTKMKEDRIDLRCVQHKASSLTI